MLTSPIARYFPSGLNDTQVAAFTLSLAVLDFPPGESDQSVGPDAIGLAPMPDSLSALLRNPDVPPVGVDGEYMVGMGFSGMAFGLAR
jgi:hypothetical protein